MNYIRTLFGVVGRLMNRVNHQRAGDIVPLDEKETLWNDMLRAGGCVKCNLTPKGFLEGPSGGMCTNIFCSRCGQGYNITPVGQWAELIHKDEKYIARETP